MGAEGLITVTDGNTTNKESVVHTLAKLTNLYDASVLVYDRWGMAELQRLLDTNNVIFPSMSPFGQGYASMAPAVSELERRILQRDIKHNGDPILRWTFQNIAIDTDPAGNRKFTKGKAKDKIDPMVALVMAVGYHASSKTELPSISFVG